MTDRTCRICDSPLIDTSYHPAGSKQRCCSMPCLRIYWRDKARAKTLRDGKAPTPHPCRICGQAVPLTPGRGRPRKTCPGCLPPPWQPHPATCSTCRRTYTMQVSTQRYCRQCQVLRNKRMKRAPRPNRVPDRQLNTQDRRALVAYIRQTQPCCHLCGFPIDTTLDKQRHPLGSCVDEIVPRSRGGSATDPGNTAHAHRCCNTSRHTKPITPEVRARCRELVLALLTPAEPPQSRSW